VTRRLPALALPAAILLVAEALAQAGPPASASAGAYDEEAALGGEAGTGAPAITPAPAWTLDPGAMPPEVADAARACRALRLGARIGAVSALFLGRPYEDGCTGEGLGPDPDPPARYDLFDCLTFIEEVLALALAPDPAWAGWYRTQLRFRGGVPSYDARHHFFEAEWVPENIAAGFIEDITPSLGEVTWIDREVTAAMWQHWRRRPRFDLPDERFPTGRQRMPVLTLDAALAAVDRIPAGAIVVTVRIPVPHLPIVVTHVGLVVPGAQPTMRHATRMSSRRVRDDRLAWYFEHLKEYTRWPVAGINVLLPREQGPRLGAVEAQAEAAGGAPAAVGGAET